MPVDIYLTQAVHGLVYGMLLFLVASGLTLVLGMMGILNLAHASFYMLGAYCGLLGGNVPWQLLVEHLDQPTYRRFLRHIGGAVPSS